MKKPLDPRELAVDLIPRSTCNVQVASVIADSWGIFSWGWNSPGSGFGECAEAAAIRRSNKNRLRGSSIYISGERKRNHKMVTTLPCEECMKLIRKYKLTFYVRCSDGIWI